MEPQLPSSLRTTNASEYTLHTVAGSRSASPSSNDRSSLLSPSATPNYGALPDNSEEPSQRFWDVRSRNIIFKAALKMAIIFIVSCAVLGGTLWLALPTLDEEDRPDLKIPKSFEQLQALNHLLKKYRDIYPYRIFLCYVITYFFLQAFSLPGSMYMSILGGAVWGVPRALPLACACVATGASLCYLISAALGPAILTVPKLRDRLQKWSVKVQSQRDNLIPFLIVLRIAPFPPHNFVNLICPHVGITLVPFWISTFLGIFGVSVIHTTIGSGLDEMTSAADFHLISWRNFFGLSAVVVGVLIPVGLKYFFKRELASISDVESAPAVVEGSEEEEEQDTILAQGPPVDAGKAKVGRLIMLDDDEDAGSDSEFDEDEDIILEAGPAIVIKAKDDDGQSLL